MERALALVEEREATKELVREAGEIASAVGAELYLLHVTSEEDFAERAETLSNISGYDSNYTLDTAQEGARQFAEDIGREVFEGLDVEYTALGRVGDTEDRIFDVADEYDVDHLFISGEKRSPAGKAIFGDLTQSVILNFDGAVTVTTV